MIYTLSRSTRCGTLSSAECGKGGVWTLWRLSGRVSLACGSSAPRGPSSGRTTPSPHTASPATGRASSSSPPPRFRRLLLSSSACTSGAPAAGAYSAAESSRSRRQRPSSSCQGARTRTCTGTTGSSVGSGRNTRTKPSGGPPPSRRCSGAATSTAWRPGGETICWAAKGRGTSARAVPSSKSAPGPTLQTRTARWRPSSRRRRGATVPRRATTLLKTNDSPEMRGIPI
mmetsp:Transcript_15076/g.50631  ORF Transcript_15076/g.50631 Transcript_15076/m.50631 type:complete len:229 (+) Transcript_15076:311-997(+)